MKPITLGILAHVDSGKTTLSEELLYQCGVLRRRGRVDHGDAYLDSDEIERERGITVFSGCARMQWGDSELTVLDTPGHIDFSAEAERTLRAADYALLLISAPDGIQSHTETLWRLLEEYRIPTFLFFNKTDLTDRPHEELIAQACEVFRAACIDFTRPTDAAFWEDVAVCDEGLTEAFLRGETPDPREAIRTRRLFPCFFGSALKSEGIQTLLDGLDRFTLPFPADPAFGARVYKITEDGNDRLTHMKITGGTLAVKESVATDRTDPEKTEKINQIRLYSGEKYEAVPRVGAGSICAVTGLSTTFVGQGLGTEADAPFSLSEPILNYCVCSEDGTDQTELLRDLRILEQEDPQLHVSLNTQNREITVRIMGEVQLEVLERVILRRFGKKVSFRYSSITYLETIAAPIEGVGHYEPLRHYAEVHLLLEPLSAGSGIVFATDCSEDTLDRNWQRLILTHLQEKTHVGVLTGSPVTDLKITLLAGRAHPKHTSGGDFRQATYRAVRHGLRSASSVLLEPWYDFRAEVPNETVGRLMTDLQQRFGEFSQPQTSGASSLLTGCVPAACIRGYAETLRGFTGGKGKLTLTLAGYRPCHNTEEVIARFGYDPDRDPDNSADSVFCSHGAGVLIPWKEVASHQHIPSCLKEKKEEQLKTKAKTYVRSLADDKELLEIFERTYGPIKSPLMTAMHTKKEPKAAPSPKPYRAKPLFTGKEYLLIDGYNIIFAWDSLARMAEQSMELARKALTDRICNYTAVHNCETIIVFDAYRVQGNPGSTERVCNLHVVYTKEAETADMYIEKVTHRLGKQNKIRVATSDHLEQLIIIGNGAVRIPADAFLAEVEDTERQIAAFLD